MIQMPNYKKLYDDCSLIKGRLAESQAKVVMLFDRIKNHPCEATLIDQEIEKLEKEMIGIYKDLQKIEA